jgi:hypothetical protein
MKVSTKKGGEFLRQAEINAINNSLVFGEEPDAEDNSKFYGYYNSQGI